MLKSSTWISVAGTIDEIRAVAKELEEDDSTKHALALKDKIMAAIYRFEEGESVSSLFPLLQCLLMKFLETEKTRVSCFPEGFLPAALQRISL